MRKIAVLLTLVMVLASFASCNLVSSPSGGSGTPHTVTYDAGEGSSVGQVTVAKLTEEASTTREGYIFCGWYLDSELKNAVSYPMNVTADITLYAKWIPESAGMTCDDASVKFALDDDYG